MCLLQSLKHASFSAKINHFCVTRIYAEWHIGIASSSNFMASSVVVTLCILDSISKMACQI